MRANLSVEDPYRWPMPHQPVDRAHTDRIVWIDCEMTGLSLDADALVEVAALVTDFELNQLGDGVDVETGRAVARCCLLNGLSVLREALGSLDRVKRVVKVVGFVSSAPGFYEQPAVVDGASRAIAEIFGDAGAHARSAVGVSELPLDSAVEVELIVEVG